jgi:hypothetical protein
VYVVLILMVGIPVALFMAYVVRTTDRRVDRRIVQWGEEPSARPEPRSPQQHTPPGRWGTVGLYLLAIFLAGEHPPKSLDPAFLEPLHGWGRVAGFIALMVMIGGFLVLLITVGGPQ